MSVAGEMDLVSDSNQKHEAWCVSKVVVKPSLLASEGPHNVSIES